MSEQDALVLAGSAPTSGALALNTTLVVLSILESCILMRKEDCA
jgi:hypothetical protein